MIDHIIFLVHPLVYESMDAETLRRGNLQIFACHGGTGAAICQARRHAQWIDQRRISVQLNNRTMQVCLKTGHTVWPGEPWAKELPEETSEYSMTLIDANSHWIRGMGLEMDTFREVVSATRILPCQTS